MLRQDVFFAERNFYTIYCIERLTKVTEMNSYSAKRKRIDEQYLGPEAASSIYERPGMGFLTTPLTSGTHSEVEPLRKRFYPNTYHVVLQNTGTIHTENRVALSGANQALSSEQIQQFINSTVLARHRTITKPQSASNVSYWSNVPSEIRPTQQNFQASDTQQSTSICRTATQSNVVPQIQGYTSVQKVAPRDSIVPRKQTQQHAKTTVLNGQTQPYHRTGPLYGQFQTRVQKVDIGEIHSQKSSVQNGQNKQCATTAKNQICPNDKKNTEKRRKRRTLKTIKASQGYQTAPNVDNNRRNKNNPEPSVGLTTTHHMTTGDHFQNSPTNQPEPWGLVPQPVLLHVKPMEAQTNQTISKLMALRQAEKMSSGVDRFENNGYSPVVVKRKLDTVQSNCTGRKRKKTKGQNGGQNSELSTEQSGGKNTVKRIVVPPKIKQNPTSYPPYVSRIMKILARGHQSQTEFSDDNYCTIDELAPKGSDELRAESTSKAHDDVNGP